MKYLIILLLASCTSSHVYVSNGNQGRAGPKAQAEVNSQVKSTVKGVEINESQ